MTILSIQSHVVFGHVGNSSAVFPLQRMGMEVWPLNTVQFSNHTGYGHWKGMVFPRGHIEELWEGIESLGLSASCDAVLSGYLGDPETGEVVLDILASIRKDNGGTIYCCDPVMGDYEEGLYVKAGIPEFFREKALKYATIIKPNRFEAELLSGVSIGGIEGARKACGILHEKGPEVIIITSLDALRAGPDEICMLLSLGEEAYTIRTPHFGFAVAPHGAGDMACALFLGYYLETRDALAAFERMTTAVYRVFEATCARGLSELALVQAQDCFAGKERLFHAERTW